jgi:Protein of unknown function (DUF2953)
MIWICAITMLLMLVITFLLYLPIHIHVRFSQRQADTDGEVDVYYLFGIIHVKRRLFGIQATLSDEGPALRATHSPKRGASGKAHEHSVLTAKEVLHIVMNWQAWLELIRDMWLPLRRLLRQTHVKHCQVSARVGTGDVVTTGVAYGTLWSVFSSIVGRMTYLCKFDAGPIISVAPDFEKPSFESTVDCIVHIRAGYAMCAAIRLVRVWRRRKTDGASHSRAHEDSHGEYS